MDTVMFIVAGVIVVGAVAVAAGVSAVPAPPAPTVRPPRRVITTQEWERLKSMQAQARADIEDTREFFAWAEQQVSP